VRESILRIARIVAGVLLVVLGIIGLVLPFLQGILFIVAGLGLLSVDIPAVRRWRVRLLRRLRQWRARRHKSPELRSPGGKQ